MSTEATQVMQHRLVELRCEKLRRMLFKSQGSVYAMQRWLEGSSSLDCNEVAMAQSAAGAVVDQLEEILEAAELIYHNPNPTDAEAEEVAS